MRSLSPVVLTFQALVVAGAVPHFGAGTGQAGAIAGESPTLEKNGSTLSSQKLKGRFLHLTDFHPDPFYKVYSSTAESAACHHSSGAAGVYGAETSDCDSPMSLLNATFDWIEDNLKDEIDFIIWTGDSARHDNDVKHPRDEKQVVGLNKLLVTKFREVFGKDDDHDDNPTNDFTIPIVPNIGNNDILPHNIFSPGPNKWTRQYRKIWRNFIPEEQGHQFDRGGWFYSEVIPKRLAVFSLNTIYFFDSNAAVDGCADPSQPGFEQLEWLRIQLQFLRERNMKAMIIGHVPPARTKSKMSWDETCWQKYTLWMRQYRDVIVSSHYGHMNIDHFMLQDFRDIKKSVEGGKQKALSVKKSNEGDDFTIRGASDYLIDLRNKWAKLPQPANANSFDEEDKERPCESAWARLLDAVRVAKKKKGKKEKYLDKIGGPYGERYSLSLVSPSVVPNYFPTLRVFTYNLTGLDDMDLSSQPVSIPPQSGDQVPLLHPGQITNSKPLPLIEESDEEDDDDFEIDKKKKKKKKKYKFTVPDAPAKSSPPGPAYSPQTLSLVGYTQYYANLTHINNDFTMSGSEDEDMRDERWKDGKHSDKKPKKHKPKPKEFKFQVEYDTTNDTVFGLKDMTMRSYIELAQRIGKSKKQLKSLNEEPGIDSIDSIDDRLELREVQEDFHESHLSGSSSESDGEGEVEVDKKKKKKKKKGKKGKKGKRAKTWFAFIERAFVGSRDPTDIQEEFGG